MRYIILVVLNTPIVLLAFVNLVTNYKLKKISGRRFRWQLVFWLLIIILLVSSFPIYNLLTDKKLLDSSELSFFDIAEITALVWLLYITNHQRQLLSQNQKFIHELHSNVSIKLSKK
jgi:energy-coupling factor transporter transmembrane protein EcfT